jgi:hypothetical protein
MLKINYCYLKMYTHDVKTWILKNAQNVKKLKN